MSIRLVLAEDHYLVREGVRRLLETHPEVEVVATCGDLDSLLAAVDAEHPDVVEQIRAGKTGAVNFLTGQVMKQTRGQANPEVVGRLLTERLQLPAS